MMKSMQQDPHPADEEVFLLVSLAQTRNGFYQCILYHLFLTKATDSDQNNSSNNVSLFCLFCLFCLCLFCICADNEEHARGSAHNIITIYIPAPHCPFLDLLILYLPSSGPDLELLWKAKSQLQFLNAKLLLLCDLFYLCRLSSARIQTESCCCYCLCKHLHEIL